jgi:heme exporter protein D
MVWNSFGEFLHMGGYGLFVWGAVTVTLVFMLSEVIVLLARKASMSKRLRERHALRDDTASDTSDGGSLGMHDGYGKGRSA